MKIGIATDHGAQEKKKMIFAYLKDLGYEIVDYSPHNTPTDDYPDYARLLCSAITNHEVDYGILMCSTGIGISIAANKIKGIRCAKISTVEEAILTRKDNDANVISLSAKTSIADAKDILSAFLNTEFTYDERHIRRIAKITDLEV